MTNGLRPSTIHKHAEKRGFHILKMNIDFHDDVLFQCLDCGNVSYIKNYIRLMYDNKGSYYCEVCQAKKRMAEKAGRVLNFIDHREIPNWNTPTELPDWIRELAQSDDVDGEPLDLWSTNIEDL